MQTIGRFQVVAELGHGAMGTVYRALDPSLERHVALKTISAGHLTRPDALARFQREARAIARLTHPNIVTVFEMGEHEGTLYIAMELLEGMDLASAMKTRGRLTLAQRVRIVAEVADALAYAHERGVIHRDVKPANIRILPDGSVKVVDFGIARLADSEFTQAGTMLGTPSYMPPEMLTRGQSDNRGDIWAVGVILYELLAGRRPYEGATIATLAYRIVNDDHPPLDAGALGLPPALPDLVARALCKDPAARFQQMSDMVRAIRAVMAATVAQASAAATPLAESRPPVEAPRAPALRAAPLPAAVPGLDVSLATPVLDELRVRGAAAFREVATFGEPPATRMACLSPVGDLLATAGADGAIRVWDLRSRTRTLWLRTAMHRRTGHDAVAISMAYRSDSVVLASGHVDGAVHLWDMRNGEEIAVKLRHEEMVSSVAFSPDGATLASGGLDCNLKLWDLSAAFAGDPRRVLHRQPAAVTALAYVDDGAHLVTGHANRVLRLLDAASGRLVATLRGPEGAVSLLTASPDGHWLAAAGQDRQLRLFDLRSRTQAFAMSGHRRTPSCVAFFDRGTHVATVAQENNVQLWDLEARAPVAALWGKADESFVSVALLGAGETVAVALADGRIRLWAAAS